MKIGLLADAHFKLYKGNNNFIPFIVKALENFERLCEEKEVDAAIFLGDIFHAKSYVQTFALDKAINSIRRITEKWPTYMVVGNHDMYINTENEKINLLKVFESDAAVFNDYGKLNIEKENVCLHFLPYNTDDVIKQKVKTIQLEKQSKNILFTHLAIKGFNLTENHEDIYSELTSEDINIGFDLIVSGHFHHHQRKGKIVYVSSPIESHFGDEGKHGYVFLDTNDLEKIDYIKNDYSPKFRTYELNKENLPFIVETKDCFLRIKINKQIDYNVLTKLKKKLDAQNYFVSFDYNINSNIQKIGVIDGWDSYIYEDTDKIVNNYIDALDTTYDKQKLRDFIFK